MSQNPTTKSKTWRTDASLYKRKLLCQSASKIANDELSELPGTVENNYNSVARYLSPWPVLLLEEDRAQIASGMIKARRINGGVVNVELDGRGVVKGLTVWMDDIPNNPDKNEILLPSSVVMISLRTPAFDAAEFSVFACVKKVKRECRQIEVAVYATDSQRQAVLKSIAVGQNSDTKPPIVISLVHTLCGSLRSIRALKTMSKGKNGVVLNAIASIDRAPSSKNPTNQQMMAFSRRMGDFAMNPSQKKACYRACDLRNHCVTLIQGPPGTGKSRTSTAIIANVAAQLRKLARSRRKKNGQSDQKRNVILVSAATNKAVQSLARMLLKHVVDGATKSMTRSGLALTRRDIVLVAASEGADNSDKNIMSIFLDQKIVEVLNKRRKLFQFLRQLEDYLGHSIKSKPVRFRKTFDAQWKEVQEARAALEDIVPLSANLANSLEKVYANYCKMLEVGWEHAHAVSALKHVRRLQKAFDRSYRSKKKLSLTGLRDMKYKMEDMDCLRSEILQQARVVFCTTVTAGSIKVRENFNASVVLIDEAAQLLETQMLIPVSLGCKKLVLVGDPQQLPATVTSTKAQQRRFQRPLFQRMLDQGFEDVMLLNQQYRMAPRISKFSNHMYYDGLVSDGPNVRSLEWNWQRKLSDLQRAEEKHLFGATRFFDLVGQEKLRDKSWFNREEAKAAAIYVRSIAKTIAICPDTVINFTTISIGVMAPYRSQVAILKQEVTKSLHAHARKLTKNTAHCHNEVRDRLLASITFGSVDAFQGSEYDVVLFSCVRSSRTKTQGSIGFVADPRRINVGLTRAKHMLAVFGNANYLSGNSAWRQLVTMWNGRKHREHQDDCVVQQVTHQLGSIDPTHPIASEDS
ncbi:MAG: hypothetical protein MHM6MM_003807 [Cercozoa sp. M6MM]